MKRMFHRQKSIGKLVMGMLIGSVIGALVGRLTATTSTMSVGKGSSHSLQERLKTAEGNVESTARELAEEVNESTGEVKKKAVRRGKEPLPLDYGEE